MIYEKMPFGKYKGKLIQNLPTTYLTYALEEFDLPKELVLDMQAVLLHRLNVSIPESNVNINLVYREMCKKYHPDNGGSNEAMAAINDFKHRLG